MLPLRPSTPVPGRANGACVERSILRQALSMLGRNLGPALVLSLGAILVQWAVAWLLARVTVPVLDALVGSHPGAFVTVGLLMNGLLTAFLLTQVGLAWHRRLLLGEATGLLTVARRPEALRYFGWVVLLLLGTQVALLGLLRLTRWTLGPWLAPLIDAVGYYPGVILFMMLPWAVVLWLLLRIGLVLPGAALGRPLSPRQSWAATASAARPLLGPALLGALAPALVWAVPWFAILVGLGPRALVVPLVLSAIALWLVLMLGLSLLAALYDSLVERRSALP